MLGFCNGLILFCNSLKDYPAKDNDIPDFQLQSILRTGTFFVSGKRSRGFGRFWESELEMYRYLNSLNDISFLLEENTVVKKKKEKEEDSYEEKVRKKIAYIGNVKRGNKATREAVERNNISEEKKNEMLKRGLISEDNLEERVNKTLGLPLDHGLTNEN